MALSRIEADVITDNNIDFENRLQPVVQPVSTCYGCNRLDNPWKTDEGRTELVLAGPVRSFSVFKFVRTGPGPGWVLVLAKKFQRPDQTGPQNTNPCHVRATLAVERSKFYWF